MAATVRNVDLTGVGEGGQFKPKRKPAGDYRAKIVKVDDHKKEGKLPGWVYTIQVDGDARATYPYYVNPEAKQAWKIRAICAAAGIKVKLSKIKFDPNKLVGKSIGVALEDDEYEGRLKSVIDDIFPVSEVGANPAAEDEEYDDAEEEETPEDEEEEEEEEPTPPPAKKKKKSKPAPPPPEDDEEEEEDEEEPPPPPKKGKKKTKKAPPPLPVDDEEEDLDLDDLDDED